MAYISKDAYSNKSYAYIKLVNAWHYLLSDKSGTCDSNFEAMDLILKIRKELVEYISSDLIELASDDARQRYCGH
jgi:hypothetical protein